MSPKISVALAVAGLLTAINLGVLVIGSSAPSRAANGGLANDPDFARAVKSVIEHCNVNVDIAKIKC
jgi:hypothetical protein